VGLYLPPNTATFSVPNSGVVAQITAAVAVNRFTLRPFPTAGLAWPPIAQGGNAPEPVVAEVLEEWSEVFLNFFS